MNNRMQRQHRPHTVGRRPSDESADRSETTPSLLTEAVQRILLAPESATPEQVMLLQQTVGNRALQRFAAEDSRDATAAPHVIPSAIVQRRLKIQAVRDACTPERVSSIGHAQVTNHTEAKGISVSRAPSPAIQRVGALSAGRMKQYKKMGLSKLLAPNIEDEKNKFAEVIKRKGNWKAAITPRSGAQTPEGEGPKEKNRRQRSFNDFIKNVPVVVIPKDTELLHMTKEASWIKTSMIGGNKTDSYSFFTLAASGSAGAHANSFGAMFKMKLKKDLHTFFLPTYSLATIETENQYGKETMKFSHPDKGGGLAYSVLDTFPPEYAPVAMAGHSEHEILIYNHAIPKVMAPVRIATLKSPSEGTGEENLEDLPSSEFFTTEEGSEPGIGAQKPSWMGTSWFNKSHKTMTGKYGKALKKSKFVRDPKLLEYFG